MSKVVQESGSALWSVYQKSYVCGACRNVFSPFKSLFFKRVRRAGYLQYHEVSSLIFLAQGDVCSLISNCHFPCRKVL